jgi:hypothetical protein
MASLKEKLSYHFYNIMNPLPRPEKEEDKFLGRFPHLSQKEVRGALRIVIDETERSRRFGLYIDNTLLEREEIFFLFVLDKLGGIQHIADSYEFDQVLQLVNEKMHNFFMKEKEYYFNKFSKEGGVKNRYDCHLISINASICQAVYNKNSLLRE